MCVRALGRCKNEFYETAGGDFGCFLCRGRRVCAAAECGAFAQYVFLGGNCCAGRRKTADFFGLKKAFGTSSASADELRLMHVNAFWTAARKRCFADGKSGAAKTFNPVLFMRIERVRARLQRAAESGRLFREYAVVSSRPAALGGLSERTVAFLEDFFRAERPELVRPQGAFLVNGGVVLRFIFEDGRAEKLLQITLNPAVPAAYVCVNECVFSSVDGRKLG